MKWGGSGDEDGHGKGARGVEHLDEVGWEWGWDWARERVG